METTQLIQSSARVIKITNLQKWDLVKYLDTQYSTVETYFWVVTDLLNTWEKSFIEILLYKKSYWDLSVEIKTFSWDKNIDIFPATIDDIEEYMKWIKSGLTKKIQDKQEELHKLEKWLKQFEEFVSWEKSKKLRTPDFIAISTEEYKEWKKLKEEQKKQLLSEIDNQSF